MYSLDCKYYNYNKEFNTINELIKDKKKINKHYMLFLFKIYDSEDGIQKCCEENDLKQELLNFYIQK